jgi:hypothetical protein
MSRALPIKPAGLGRLGQENCPRHFTFIAIRSFAMDKVRWLARGLKPLATVALVLGIALVGPNIANAIDDAGSQPTIIPRSVWGAREPSCQWQGTDGDRVTHVTIHHTYEPTDPPSLESAYAALQHIQNLHMDDNGWCDIGYSYLVDWFGNVYEGSVGTIGRPRTTAHTAGLNFEGVGIALIGNYMEIQPSAQTIASAGKVAAWVLGWYGTDSGQDVSLTVRGGNNKWASGTRITVPAITAHRDVVTTECPGNAGYPLLPLIREQAALVTAVMKDSGKFGEGVGSQESIFAIGEPVIPIGQNAGNAELIVQTAGLALATDATAPTVDVTPTPTSTATTSSPDQTANPTATNQPENPGDNMTIGESVTFNIWWVAAIVAAVVVGFAVWWIFKRRPNSRL